MRKRMDPRVKDKRSDDFPETLTDCVRPCRNDSSHDRTVPWTPNDICKRSSRMSWSTVSNAADKSSKHSRVTSPRSAARSMSVITFRTAVSVEWFLLYRRTAGLESANYVKENQPASGRQAFQQSWTWMLSLRLVCSFVSKPDFLIRGLIMAWRWLKGRQPCCSDALHRSVIKGNSSGRNFLGISVGMGSSSHDLEEAPIMAVLTSVALQGWNSSKVSVADGILYCCNVTTAGGLPYGCYLGFKEIRELLSCWTVLWQRVFFSLAPINVFNDRQSCRGCFAWAFTRTDQ